MREIKFRVWDGDIMRSGADLLVETADGTVWKNIGWNADELTPINPVELMQFTGLHDKNGREIYEGDILNYKTNRTVDGWTVVGTYGYHPESARVVSWSNGAFRIDHAQLAEELFWRKDYEVIGNIHESPELLE